MTQLATGGIGSFGDMGDLSPTMLINISKHFFPVWPRRFFIILWIWSFVPTNFLDLPRALSYCWRSANGVGWKIFTKETSISNKSYCGAGNGCEVRSHCYNKGLIFSSFKKNCCQKNLVCEMWKKICKFMLRLFCCFVWYFILMLKHWNIFLNPSTIV